MAQDWNGIMEKGEIEKFLIYWKMSCKKKKKKKKKDVKLVVAFGSFIETVLYLFYDPIAVGCNNFTLNINGVDNI